MNVSELSELRQALRNSAIDYRVVKNTLARIAAKDTPLAVAVDSFKGPVGLVLGYDDAAGVAKGVIEFIRKNKKLKVTGGVIDGAFCDPEELKQIAELPPREALLGIMAGTMQAPVVKLLNLLSATIQSFAYAVNALKDRKG